MCNKIIMPNGKEVSSINEDNSCTCTNTQEEIFIWIIKNIKQRIMAGERLVITQTPFDYEVKIEEDKP